MAHLNNSTGIRIVRAAALALLVGGGLVSPALADWQPRASVAAQPVEVQTTVRDWQPRRSTAGAVVIRSAIDTGSSWTPRSSLGAVGPALLITDAVSTGWNPRSAVAGSSSAIAPVSADWKPRASLKPDAVTLGGLSRRRHELVTTVDLETLAASSISY